jgi:hypothetical protein
MTTTAMERWLAERVLRHVEPRMERWMDGFLRSADGQALIADVMADLVADLARPAGDDQDLVERVVITLAGRLAENNPSFRRRLLEALAPR